MHDRLRLLLEIAAAAALATFFWWLVKPVYEPLVTAAANVVFRVVPDSDVQELVLRFPKAGAHMIDNNELKSHCAQYILPVGLVFGRVMIDDILHRGAATIDHLRGQMNDVSLEDAVRDGGYPECRFSSAGASRVAARWAIRPQASAGLAEPKARDDTIRQATTRARRPRPIRPRVSGTRSGAELTG